MGWFRNLVAPTRGRQANAGEVIPFDDNDWWFTSSGRPSSSGMNVSPDSALRYTAVYTCVKVIADTISTAPLGMIKMLPDGGSEPAYAHPLDELIRFQPNKIQTAVEFWGMMCLHAALRGTAYAEIKPGPRGAVDQLVPIHPDRVKQELLSDGTLRFRLTDPVTNEIRILLQEEMFRMPGISSDGYNALRPVELGADSIGLGMATEEYASKVFSNGINLGGFFSYPGKMSLDAMKRLMARLTENFTGPRNFHRPMILQGGMKFEQASMTAEQAQLKDAREFQIRDVARRWHIPLHMLGMDDQTNRSTVEEQSINFVKYTLRPWCRRIEQAIRRDLIIATAIYEAKFNLDALQRGNTAAVADYASKALGSGGTPPWMTQNEVRVMVGLNRRPESHADELAVGTNPSGDTATQAPTKPKAEQISPPAEVFEIEDNTNRARAERLAAKECKALRTAIMRYADDPDAFRTWVRAFYGGHVSDVMKIIGWDREIARLYCETQKTALLNANDWLGVIDSRDENLANEIERAMKIGETVNG